MEKDTFPLMAIQKHHWTRYDEAALSHAAHKIIYRNLFEKFKELEKNRARFKDESTSLYRAAIEKYNAELLDENAPFKI